MADIWVNKEFEIQGERIEVDYDAYRTLNILASKFYSVLGYEAKEDHDFFESQHPTENAMFQMAMEAYAHHIIVGFD